jgi:hypothetical protein
VPEDRLLLVVPREDSGSVGQEQPSRAEVAADGQQAVLGVLDRGKGVTLVEPVDRQRRGS